MARTLNLALLLGHPIQCQLEQQKRHFCTAPTINVSEQKVVTNNCVLSGTNPNAPYPHSISTFNGQYISHHLLLMAKFVHHHST